MPTPRTRPRARSLDSRGDHQQLTRQTTLCLGAFAGLLGYFLLCDVMLKRPVLPPYTVGSLTFTPFGPLVALGMCFGIHLTRRWCRRFDLEWPTLHAGVAWVLCAGVVMAHLMALGDASPAKLFNLRDLLNMRSDLSSFGGFLGGTIAAVMLPMCIGIWRPRPIGRASIPPAWSRGGTRGGPPPERPRSALESAPAAGVHGRHGHR